MYKLLMAIFYKHAKGKQIAEATSCKLSGFHFHVRVRQAGVKGFYMLEVFAVQKGAHPHGWCGKVPKKEVPVQDSSFVFDHCYCSPEWKMDGFTPENYFDRETN